MSSFKNLIELEKSYDQYSYMEFWDEFQYKIRSNRYFNQDYVQYNLNIFNQYNKWLNDNNIKQMEYIIPTCKRIILSPKIKLSDIHSINPLNYSQTYNVNDFEYDITYDEKTPINFVEFCHEFLRRRWKEAEDFILYHPQAICIYSILVIKTRWIEHEKLILKCKDSNPSILYAYIKEFFENHFPESEINTNPLFDTWYEIMLEKITPTGER